MNMVRSFLPVGQGAFYLEQFGLDDETRINVVYDCGAYGDSKPVEEQIRRSFKKGETIHAVFISHLHSDHINGLSYLVRYCDVKNIYFPLITSKYKSYMSIYSKVTHAGELVEAFIEGEPERILSVLENEQVVLHPIGVDESTGDNWREEEVDVSGEIFEPSGALVKKHEWLYIPFNFECSARAKKLEEALDKAFPGKTIDGKVLEEIWKNGTPADRDKIKEAYRSVRGDFNTNSMVLFSGETTGRYVQEPVCVNHLYVRRWGHSGCLGCLSRRKCFGCMVDLSRAGWLYTGDYDTTGVRKWKQMWDKYGRYRESIGGVQIPHHGSRHNYNPDLNKFDYKYAVISAGENNIFKHPHKGVLKDLLLRRKAVFWVNEKEETEACFYIHD